MGTRIVGRLVGCVVLLLALLAPRPAEAHSIGLSSGEYAAGGNAVTMKAVFARGEIAGMVAALDDNRDGHVTALEIEQGKRSLEAQVLGKIHVTSAGAACPATLVAASITEQDGLALEGRFDCPSRGPTFDVDVALLDDLSRGHRHVARAVGAPTHDEVLTRGHATFVITPAAPAATTTAAAGAGPAPRRPSAWSFFAMGIEHILTGYDHLVFLFGLVLLRATVKQLLAVITAFTVAHSITLAVAVLGLFTPSPRFVEPAIALSIVYVGIESFFVKDGSKRWRITFPFGLVHGFGFAGALGQIDLPRAEIPAALVSFNLGVEAGQLLALALLLPMVMRMRRTTWFEPRGVQVLSAAVALAGGLWFVLRVAGG